ncbi:hypothetical protein ACQ4LE_005638 [Meloidogyne hapla]
MDNAMEFVDSRLGTQEYWDKFYDEELANFSENGGEGEIWFGRLCEAKIVEFLIKKAPKDSFICDLGTGNGSILRKLSNFGFLNLFGIDYSPKALELAKNISFKNYSNKIKFLLANISGDKVDSELEGKFDILLDKGTFDAISLTNKSEREKHLKCYQQNICQLFKRNKFDGNTAESPRFLLIFSCNFTRNELINLLENKLICFDCELPTNNNFEFGGFKGCGKLAAAFLFNITFFNSSNFFKFLQFLQIFKMMKRGVALLNSINHNFVQNNPITMILVLFDLSRRALSNDVNIV